METKYWVNTYTFKSVVECYKSLAFCKNKEESYQIFVFENDKSPSSNQNEGLFKLERLKNNLNFTKCYKVTRMEKERENVDYFNTIKRFGYTLREPNTNRRVYDIVLSVYVERHKLFFKTQEEKIAYLNLNQGGK